MTTTTIFSYVFHVWYYADLGHKQTNSWQEVEVCPTGPSVLVPAFVGSTSMPFKFDYRAMQTRAVFLFVSPCFGSQTQSWNRSRSQCWTGVLWRCATFHADLVPIDDLRFLDRLCTAYDRGPTLDRRTQFDDVWLSNCPEVFNVSTRSTLRIVHDQPKISWPSRSISIPLPKTVQKSHSAGFFIFFISVAVFVMLNLVTAVIVENAFSDSKSEEKELAVRLEREKEEELEDLTLGGAWAEFLLCSWSLGVGKIFERQTIGTF